MRRLSAHLAEQDIALELTEAAKDELARQGYDPEFGARPLKRAIQKHVQSTLADAILSGKLARGQTAEVDVAERLFLVRAKEGVPSESVPA